MVKTHTGRKNGVSAKHINPHIRYQCFRRLGSRHAHAWIQIWRPSPRATMCPLPLSLWGDVLRMRIRSYEPPFYVRPSLLKREKIISVALS